MNSTELQLHIAAQYLAATAKNYVPLKDDDSHTNLGWLDDKKVYQSRQFSNGDFLQLNTCDMKLQWIGKRPENFGLIGSTHNQVISWLDTVTKNNDLNNFEFNLHYQLDSGELKDDFIFSKIDPNYCDKLSRYRIYADAACSRVLKKLKLEGEVRTWPHHFDTGSYVQVDDIGIGFGMAVPDAISKEYYLYTSGYKGHDGISPQNMPSLAKGEWRDGQWKGAILSVENLELGEWVDFLEETIQAFMKLD